MGWPADVPAAAHLFVASASDLGDSLEVGGEDGHHLGRVLRLRPGELVTAADGDGAWRPYRLAAVDGGTVRLEATGATDREPAPSARLAVAFALTKGEKPDFTVQKLTELGIDRIVPVVAERSVSRPGGAKARVVTERWRRIAREAARQCRRATVPGVEEVGALTGLAGHPGLVVAVRGGCPAARLPDPEAGEVLVVIGPEGGLAENEIEELDPWARLDLGPTVLRAETAAIAAATLVAARFR
jgi:16S rRNA (uracil1498-N3)-methyltransferase